MVPRLDINEYNFKIFTCLRYYTISINKDYIIKLSYDFINLYSRGTGDISSNLTIIVS
jgi:hypothetical protein